MSVTMLMLAVVGGIAIALMVLTLIPAQRESLLRTRLASMPWLDITEIVDPDEAELQRPISERVLAPIAQSLGRFLLRRTKTAQLDQLRVVILRAGSHVHPEALLALRAILVPVGAGVGLVLVNLLNLTMPLAVLPVMFVALLGYQYPVSALRGKVKRRAREIRLALPGVLDLLTISMEAGLALDMAIMRVAEADRSLLGEEFQKVLNEVRLGRPRGEALTAMADRNDVDELRAFVSAVVQAEPLGVSVANVLRIQSEELRRIRRQRAEAAGHRAPVLMLLPMMGCIFPCIFISLLGPAVLSIVSGSH